MAHIRQPNLLQGLRFVLSTRHPEGHCRTSRIAEFYSERVTCRGREVIALADAVQRVDPVLLMLQQQFDIDEFNYFVSERCLTVLQPRSLELYIDMRPCNQIPEMFFTSQMQPG